MRIISSVEKEQIKKWKKLIMNNLPEIMALFGFVLYYLSQFYYTTMFIFPKRVIQVVKYSGLVIILLKVIIFDRKKYNIKQLLLLFITFILLVLTAYFSTYRFLLEYMLVILGFRDINYQKALYCFMITGFIALSITFICSKVGIVENVVTYRGEISRESFGIIYATDFAAYFFYLFAIYVCLNDSMSLIKMFIFIILTALLYSVTNARLDCICLIILCFINRVFTKMNNKLINILLIKFLLKNMFLICGIAIILLTTLYSFNIKGINTIDKIINKRLSLGNSIFEKYGIQFFGQKIEEHGAGGSKEKIVKYQYEFIDSSYIKMIVKYGIIATIIVSLYSLTLSYKYMDIKDNKIICVFAVIFINSMIAHHYLEIAYNFMIPIFLCNIEVNDKCHNIEKVN